MSIRFRVHDWTRDPRSDYLRACGEALEHQQRLRFEHLKARLNQGKLPAWMRRQAD